MQSVNDEQTNESETAGADGPNETNFIMTDKKCPYCEKFLQEVWDGWICSCGYEDRIVPEPVSQQTIIDQEVHNNFWLGTEPETEEAKEYCDYWYGEEL